LTPLCILTCFV
jgi:GPI-anchor transamidase subunit GAA1